MGVNKRYTMRLNFRLWKAVAAGICCLVAAFGLVSAQEQLSFDPGIVRGMQFAGDQPLSVSYVISDDRIPGYLDINIKAVIQDSIIDYEWLENNLRITEVTRSSEEALDVQKVAPKKFDMVTVMVDISSSMWRQHSAGGVFVDSAKAICDSVLKLVDADYMLKLDTFDEQLYEHTPQTIMEARRPVEARYTHLFECTSDALGRMADAEGEKLLIIIGDGENDHTR